MPLGRTRAVRSAGRATSLKRVCFRVVYFLACLAAWSCPGEGRGILAMVWGTGQEKACHRNLIAFTSRVAADWAMPMQSRAGWELLSCLTRRRAR